MAYIGCNWSPYVWFSVINLRAPNSVSLSTFIQSTFCEDLLVSLSDCCELRDYHLKISSSYYEQAISMRFCFINFFMQLCIKTISVSTLGLIVVLSAEISLILQPQIYNHPNIFVCCSALNGPADELNACTAYSNRFLGWSSWNPASIRHTHMLLSLLLFLLK